MEKFKLRNIVEQLKFPSEMRRYTAVTYAR
jgi:hypothetical protein